MHSHILWIEYAQVGTCRFCRILTTLIVPWQIAHARLLVYVTSWDATGRVFVRSCVGLGMWNGTYFFSANTHHEVSTSNHLSVNVDVCGQQWQLSGVGKPCFVFSVSITSQVVSRGGWDRGTFAEMFKNMCCGPVHKNMEGHLELQANLCIFDASWPSQSRGPCDRKQHHTTRWYTLASRPWVCNVYRNMEVHLELQLQVNLCILDASWPSLSHVIQIGPIKPVDISVSLLRLLTDREALPQLSYHLYHLQYRLSSDYDYHHLCTYLSL